MGGPETEVFTQWVGECLADRTTTRSGDVRSQSRLPIRDQMRMGIISTRYELLNAERVSDAATYACTSVEEDSSVRHVRTCSDAVVCHCHTTLHACYLTRRKTAFFKASMHTRRDKGIAAVLINARSAALGRDSLIHLHGRTEAVEECWGAGVVVVVITVGNRRVQCTENIYITREMRAVSSTDKEHTQRYFSLINDGLNRRVRSFAASASAEGWRRWCCDCTLMYMVCVGYLP